MNTVFQTVHYGNITLFLQIIYFATSTLAVSSDTQVRKALTEWRLYEKKQY